MSYPARMILRTRTGAVKGKGILTLSNVQVRRYHKTGDKPVFHWEDPLDIESQLSEDEIAIRDTARDFCR
ncbi:hypothetical protein EDB89DRAFT_424275 [Lactarius sanguifluus]|nr:hypothetical protein EDB89DRAFT_424275 [Lactarius sanguifluus]